MSVFDLVAFFFLVSTTAVILNRRFFKLPETSWLLMFSMGISIVFYLINLLLAEDVMSMPKKIMTSTDMPYVFMHGALPLLLFSGAMQMNLKALLERVISITALTVPGAIISIFAFATGFWLILPICGIHLSYTWCIVAGSILSPTDPVSVVSILKRLGLPAPVQAVVAGESLFNDGVAVAMFTLFLGVALVEPVGAHHVAYSMAHFNADLNNGFNIFLREGVGGIIVGYCAGYIGARTLRSNNDAHIALLVTITMAICTYSFAAFIDTSGAIAVVVAGLWLGTDYVTNAVDDRTKVTMRKFWEIIEEILNSLLFLTMGAEILLMFPGRMTFGLIVASILLSLLSRGMGVVIATLPLPILYDTKHRLWTILTWGGLRGGVSIALALGLPECEAKTVLAPVCYSVVAFSIIVQGLTMEKLTKKLYGHDIGDQVTLPAPVKLGETIPE